MPKICYIERKFARSSQEIIDRANAIIAEYTAQGYDLTLRQLYYQFVARDLIPNRDTEYKRLGSIINDARLAGLVDWDAIQDRTRNLQTLSHWETPEDIIRASVDQFQHDRWRGQEFRPEVWIEKDALLGVIQGVCEEFDVPYFSCRGYTSQSEMWSGGRRMGAWLGEGSSPVVLHLGDHDPSGIDMTRDIVDRLAMFAGGVEVKRLALNMDQVQQYGPPPNPAKTTDSRYIGYIGLHGDESWELDALEPAVLTALVREAVLALRDEAIYEEVREHEEEDKAHLSAISERWEDVVNFLENGHA